MYVSIFGDDEVVYNTIEHLFMLNVECYTTVYNFLYTLVYFRHVKQHHLYDSLRRPSNMYASQELRMDFGYEIPSRFSTYRGGRGKDDEIPLEGSFGLGYVNSGFTGDGDTTSPKTPHIWHTSDEPRIPRWNTSDSLKDALQSLEDLTSRLNSEDNISAVTNMSRERRSLKSNKSGPSSPRGPESASRPVTPRSEGPFSDIEFDNADTIGDIDNAHTIVDTVVYENIKINPPVIYLGGKSARQSNGLQHTYMNVSGNYTYEHRTQESVQEASTAF